MPLSTKFNFDTGGGMQMPPLYYSSIKTSESVPWVILQEKII